MTFIIMVIFFNIIFSINYYSTNNYIGIIKSLIIQLYLAKDCQYYYLFNLKGDIHDNT